MKVSAGSGGPRPNCPARRRMGGPIAGFAILAALSVSCGPKPAGTWSPAPTPATFSATGIALPADRWWSDFSDTTLNRLVVRALDDNLTLRVAWDRLAQAEAIARREGASLIPSASASAGVGVSQTRSESKGTSNEAGGSLDLAASYEVDLWGRVRAVRDAATMDARASGEDLRTAAITLSAQVATTWYRLVQQRGQIDLLERQLRSNEEVLELVMLRFRQGQTRAEDVLQQRQEIESQRGAISRARANAEVFEHQLAVLLGQVPTAIVGGPSMRLVDLPSLPATGVPAELIRRRPDARSAYYVVHAADRRVASAIADRFPRISLTAGASTSMDDAKVLFDNWFASLAGNLVMPVIDGGRRRAEVERTRAAVSASVNNYGSVVLNALAEVEDALARDQRQAEYIASLERQLELAGSVIERSRDNYLKGLSDYIRVITAQQTYQTLERTLLDARLARIEMRIALYRALSGGWEMTRRERASAN